MTLRDRLSAPINNSMFEDAKPMINGYHSGLPVTIVAIMAISVNADAISAKLIHRQMRSEASPLSIRKRGNMSAPRETL